MELDAASRSRSIRHAGQRPRAYRGCGLRARGRMPELRRLSGGVEIRIGGFVFFAEEVDYQEISSPISRSLSSSNYMLFPLVF